MPSKPPILTLTDSAVARVKTLLAARGKPSVGIRISLKTKGCSGLAYALEYADEIMPLDEQIDYEDLKILVDPKAIMFILGTTMDFVEEDLQSGFIFRNPNEKGRCGCGESFHV